MKIIGCDFHTRYQQISMLDDETGELIERRLEHENGEADKFYRDLSKPIRVGVEATGPLHWFERLLAELVTSCGSEIRRRSAPAKCASRKPISETPNSFSI